jgi:hypothetical protein
MVCVVQCERRSRGERVFAAPCRSCPASSRCEANQSIQIMLNQPCEFSLTCYGSKVLHQRMPAALAPDAVHAMTPAAAKDKADGSFGLFIIPAVGDQACMLVNWSVRRRVPHHPVCELSVTWKR